MHTEGIEYIGTNGRSYKNAEETTDLICRYW